MSTITISVDEDIEKIISKRAKKNLLTIKEQVEEIIRQSAVRTKAGAASSDPRIDDRLVSIFSRDRRGKAKKKKRL